MNNAKLSKLGIPDWFDLGKYSPNFETSLVDWGCNFSLRSQTLRYLNASNKPNMFIERGKVDFSLIKQQGFVTRKHAESQIDAAQYDLDTRINFDNGIGHGLVYSLPLIEAYEISRGMQADTEIRHKLELIKYNEIYHHQREQPLTKTEHELAHWYESEFSRASYNDYDVNSCTTYACIDLDAPEEKIIEAFKSWLKSMKSSETHMKKLQISTDIPRNFSESTVSKWIKNSVLPYIDLVIYQAESEIKLPFHVIGQAIFPDSIDIDTTEAVRKTTHPMAMRALDMCWTILAQGLRDEAIKYGKK